MRAVAVLGAGEVGGALAYKLATRDRIGEIRLIDAKAGAGKALDIAQAAPVERFGTRVLASSDPFVLAGADVVVLADSAGDEPDWSTEAGLTRLRRLAPLARDAVFVYPGPDPSVVRRAVAEAGLGRSRVLGSAPHALAGAVRALAALEAGCLANEVALTLLGLPPNRVVPVWSGATIRGMAATRLLDPPSINRLAARVPHLWPLGPYALASSTARVCEAILEPRGASFTCFMLLDGELGARGRVTALPVIVGRHGVERTLEPPLDRGERVALENALVVEQA